MARNQNESRTSRAGTSTSTLLSTLVVVAVLGAGSLAPMPSCHAFQPSAKGASLMPSHSVGVESTSSGTQLFAFGRSKRDEQHDDSNINANDADVDQSITSNQGRSMRQRFRKKAKMAALGAFTALSLHLGGSGNGALPALRPPAAITRHE